MMRLASVQRILGFLIALSSLMMLPPAAVSLWYGDGTMMMFLSSAGILALLGLLIFLPVRHHKRELRLHDGFLVVVGCWVALALVGALPFVLLQSPSLTYIEALFESMSGLTTTGATIITHIEELPKGVLYYRQQLQWLGGMGIIVLAVAILPMLRIGGMQLYRAETPGPIKDAKLTPRITETAKALWLIYLGITVFCAAAYWLAGMSLFDAIGHAFSTVAIGGFSTHDASIAYFDNSTIELVAIIFMFISGVNFALHFTAWRRASMQAYFADPELKVYAGLLVALALLASIALFLKGTYGSFAEALRYGAFQMISAMTTTGFTSTEFYLWGGFVPILMMTVAFIGGCAGSTAGGMKVIRVILLYRQSAREIRRLIHPHAVIQIRVGDQQASSSVMNAVWGFFFLYIATFTLVTVLLNATGIDSVSAFSAAAASITNLGPGLSQVGANYSELNGAAKLVLSFAMLAGRLEIYTLLVLLTPAFWRD
jgi:trk system potassium uptake protein TrkH